MAQALLQMTHGKRVFVDSCGLRPERGGEIDPFAAIVLDEVGADLTGHKAKSFDDLEDGSFDLVISLTPEVLMIASPFSSAMRSPSVVST